MKVLILSGNHPRHFFYFSGVLKNFDVVGVVCVLREEMLPVPPPGILPADAKNFERHFKDRFIAEQKYFSTITAQEAWGAVPVEYCTPESFNSEKVVAFVKAAQADVALVYGTELIQESLLNALPQDKLNMHGGLSPWYRGTATLFWPFYNMQPQYSGSTLHFVIPQVDAGIIVHQSVPALAKGDGIHDVACKTVIQSQADLGALLSLRASTGHFEGVEQRSTGRIYRKKDFRPEHLRVIYDLFNNDMVDAYLRGELMQEAPVIVNGLKNHE